jgi:hypothetical protein
VPIVLKSGSLNLLESSGRFQACSGIALPLTLRLLATHLDVNVSLCAIVTVTISVNFCVLSLARAVFCYIPKQRSVTGIKSSENRWNRMRLRACVSQLNHWILTYPDSSDVNNSNVMVSPTSEVRTVLNTTHWA